MTSNSLRPLLCLFLFLVAAPAFATPCAGCSGSCGKGDGNCACVIIEGCTCCGARTDRLSAAPPSSGATEDPRDDGLDAVAQACVKDTAGKRRCGDDEAALKKLPGKRTPPTVTLKRGMTRNIEATPKDVYELIKQGKGQLDLSGPVTTAVKTAAGKTFNLTLAPDGSVRECCPFRDISAFTGNADPAAGGGTGSIKIVVQDQSGVKQTRVPVTTAEGLGFDLVLKQDGTGAVTGMLLPAIQKVR